jgi:hypothetical protein
MHPPFLSVNILLLAKYDKCGIKDNIGRIKNMMLYWRFNVRFNQGNQNRAESAQIVCR